MSKIILRAVLSLALTISFLARTESDLPLTLMGLYESDWHLAQDILITQPRTQTDTVLKTASKFAASVAAGYVWKNFLSDHINLFCYKMSGEDERYDAWYALRKKELDEGTSLTHLYSLPSGFVKASIEERSANYIIPSSIQTIPVDCMVAIASFFLLRKKAIRNAEREQLKKVIGSWPSLRERFPAKLHESFDRLHELSKQESNSTEYDTLLPKVMLLTKELLAIHLKLNSWLSPATNAFNTLFS